MSLWESYLEQVVETGRTLVIPCNDKAQQNSIKTILFRARQKMPSVVSDLLRISNMNTGDSLAIKVYVQTQPEAFFLGDDGEMTPVNLKVIHEDDRIVSLMKEDGMSEDEIQEYLKSKGGEKE